MTGGLDDISIVKDCPMQWDSMSGGDRVRHCDKCRKNVYNIEDMTRQEAEDLIRDSGGNFCARFYRRKDGTIVTRDCGALDLARVKFYSGLTAMAAAAGFVLMPVHTTGVVLPPASEARDLVRRNHDYAEILKEETDPAAREEIQRKQAELRERFRNVLDEIK